jgi:hypothetical protein
MQLVTDVPLNTMIADLDETVRNLLKRELGRHGFDNVEVVFDAPSREWSGQLSGPTVNVFLYDLRESPSHRPVEWEGGAGQERRPPLRVECSFAITAWTQDVQDEHRLLSQVLAILYAYSEIPEDFHHGRLRGGQPYPLSTTVGQTRAEGKADFWNAVGGQYKASLDYVVTLSCESGTVLVRGPEVRTQSMMLGQVPGRASVLEMHRVGGTVKDPDGNPVPNVWVTLPDAGLWTSSDRNGRFIFDRIRPGSHRCLARAVDGTEVEAEFEVPGNQTDLVLGGPTKKKGGKK